MQAVCVQVAHLHSNAVCIMKWAKVIIIITIIVATGSSSSPSWQHFYECILANTQVSKTHLNTSGQAGGP